MSISQLVKGPSSYLYDFKRTESKPTNFNMDMLRGSAGHAYISRMLNDEDESTHLLRYTLPKEWKDGSQGITIVGHYDNIVNGNVLLEHKFPRNIPSEVLKTNARRQIQAYAWILEKLSGKEFQAFICYYNSTLEIEEVPRKNFRDGWIFVQQTAYSVAEALDL